MGSYKNEVFTTFLLLRPSTTNRPAITNTELPAGHGFNLALRAMASRDGFQTQWFGWQHQPSSAPDSEGSPDRLFWVINWQESSSARALALTGELEQTMGDLTQFFELPKVTPNTHCVTLESETSSILVVHWCQGDAQKLLNWTNRDLVMGVLRNTSQEAPRFETEVDAVKNDSWLAYGQVVAPEAEDENCTSAKVVLRSVQLREQAQELTVETPADAEIHDCSDGFVRVSLTRTRWCTKIRKDLMETIKSRRVD